MNGAFTFKELVSAVPHTTVTGGDCPVTGLSADTRSVRPGDMMFCIKGLNYDAHGHIGEALNRGAAAFVTERPCAFGIGAPAVLVDSARRALSLIAEKFYNNPSDSMHFIGVTGTNGKTSVTYFIEAILREAGYTTGVIGTLKAAVNGEDMGVKFTTSTTPDTLELYGVIRQMREQNVNGVAMEVSSHSLALYKTDGIKFKTGVFTNLTRDHLDFHHTMGEYLNAKKRLFTLCETGVINKDDGAYGELISNIDCKIITYGINEDCDIRAGGIDYNENGVSFTAKIYGENILFEIPVYGRFNVYNALAAIGAAVSVNVPAGKIREGLRGLKGIPGRFQTVPNDKNVNVLVDYAHTPDGLSNVLRTAREMSKGRLIAVFGCGGDRDRQKRPMMGKAAGSIADCCVVTSDNPRSENRWTSSAR